MIIKPYSNEDTTHREGVEDILRSFDYPHDDHAYQEALRSTFANIKRLTDLTGARNAIVRVSIDRGKIAALTFGEPLETFVTHRSDLKRFFKSQGLLEPYSYYLTSLVNPTLFEDPDKEATDIIYYEMPGLRRGGYRRIITDIASANNPLVKEGDGWNLFTNTQTNENFQSLDIDS